MRHSGAVWLARLCGGALGVGMSCGGVMGYALRFWLLLDALAVEGLPRIMHV